MIQNNYYTPDLSEFRLGFRYEQKHCNSWEDCTITSIDDLDSIYDLCYHTNKDCLAKFLRVKCLSDDDIMSLGFKKLTSATDIIEYQKEDVSIYFKSEFCFISIYEDSQLRFSGKIKNVNELEDILEKIS